MFPRTIGIGFLSEGRFGADAVLAGVCVVSTEIDSQGRTVQLADFQSLSYGELDGKKTSRIEAAHQVFHGPGFDSAGSGDRSASRPTTAGGCGIASDVLRSDVQRHGL